MKNSTLEKHCMVDLETLGVNAKSPVIQIGATMFTTEGISMQVLMSIDFEDALKHGEPDGSTIKWWLQQGKGAQEALFNNVMPAQEACEKFRLLIENQNPDHFWAHASFDFPIIDSLYRSCEIKNPINHRKIRDIRTLEYLAPSITWEKREGIHHNALDDAVYQTKHTINMLKALKEKMA